VSRIKFQRGRRQPLRLIKDQQFNEVLIFNKAAAFHVAMEVLVNTNLHPCDMLIEHRAEVPYGFQDRWRVEDGARACQGGMDLRAGRVTPFPRFDQRASQVPLRIAARGQGFADTRRPIAQPNVAVRADRLRKRREAPMLLGDDECAGAWVGHGTSS
jgi:hypothetical protein